MNYIKSASIDKKELEKFLKMSDEWWDKNGKFRPLHQFNPLRTHYIREAISKHFSLDNTIEKPLNGIAILDIGCGGGLLSEALALLGANVTGIDALEQNINIAATHAEKSNLDITYKTISVEELSEEKQQFDVILNMEVLEHVANVESFMSASCSLLKPEGIILIATLNRTIKSFAFAIIGAEYLLRWLPRGTHNWNKFLRPAEIETHLQAAGIKLQEIQGITYSPFEDIWKLSEDIDVNYMMLAAKS